MFGQLDLVLHVFIFFVRQLQHVLQLAGEHLHIWVINAKARVKEGTFAHVLLLDLRVLILHHVYIEHLLAIESVAQLSDIVIDRGRFVAVVEVIEQLLDCLKLLLIDHHDVLVSLGRFSRIFTLGRLVGEEDAIDEVRNFILSFQADLGALGLSHRPTELLLTRVEVAHCVMQPHQVNLRGRVLIGLLHIHDL